MNAVWVVVLAVWAWGWGWWAHDASLPEVLLAAAWPVLLPLGHAYHAYRFGWRHRRFVYMNTRWWQRGEITRRPPSWMSKTELIE